MSGRTYFTILTAVLAAGVAFGQVNTVSTSNTTGTAKAVSRASRSGATTATRVLSTLDVGTTDPLADCVP